MGNDDVIEFNGKRYDALTGKVLGKSHSDVAEPLAPPVKRRNMDDIVHKHPTEALGSPTKVKQHKPMPFSRNAPPHLKHHRPQSAKTLMRRAVHKPKVTMKPNIKSQIPAEVPAKPVSAVAVKHSVRHGDPVRGHRAQHIPQSQAVKHFTNTGHHQPAPVFQPAQMQAPIAPIVHPKTARHTKQDMFEAAIARANSHEHPPVTHKPERSKHKKLTGVLAAFTLLLAVGGFLTYVNRAAIELKIASFQAGFAAQLPSHRPTGFELADVQNQPGQIVLQYRSGNRNYQITQQPTDWSSQTLGDHIIAGAGSNTIQSKGRTVYIYDNIASWVSGGVRYDITGNAELDRNEIAAIAGSM